MPQALIVSSAGRTGIEEDVPSGQWHVAGCKSRRESGTMAGPLRTGTRSREVAGGPSDPRCDGEGARALVLGTRPTEARPSVHRQSPEERSWLPAAYGRTQDAPRLPTRSSVSPRL